MLRDPDPVTAIIAGNDTIALGVLEAAKRSNVDVPGQLSIIGFDDMPLAGSPLVGLTSIRHQSRPWHAQPRGGLSNVFVQEASRRRPMTSCRFN